MEIKTTVNIPLTRKPVNIAKLQGLLELDHIDGKVLDSKNQKNIREFLDSYFDSLIRDVKGFDGVVFQKSKKVIRIGGSAYIQAITENNYTAWVWESIDLDDYSTHYDIQREGIKKVLKEKLEEKLPELWVAYYFFCKKNGFEVEFGYGQRAESVFKEKLEERINWDIQAEQQSYYTEGWETDYLNKHLTSNSENELYDTLEEAREEYEGTEEQEEDHEWAKEDVLKKWKDYAEGDKLVGEVIEKLN